MRTLIALLLLGLLTGAVHAQQIYRSVDADGKLRFTTDKPPGGVQSNAPVPRAEVRMYATDWCPYCKQARQFFARNGIRYTELDIEKSAAAKAEYRNLGGRGVPVILVGAQRMDGFGEARLSQMLKSAGY